MTMTIDEIMKSLPHRYPILLVDRILECDDKARIVGLKNVTINEPFFNGHFPGMPIMPGVLQLEAMAQTAGILANRIINVQGVLPFFMAIDNARFRKVIKPGDQMRIEINITNARSKTIKFNGKVSVDGQVASEADMMCMLTDQKVGS